MKKNMKKALLLTTIISLSTGTLNFIAPVYAETAAAANRLVITGKVVDSRTNRGIKDAYIKQLNTLNTVLSNDNGSFTINLEKSAEKRITISKEGYESLQIDVSNGEKDIKVVLYPALKYQDENLPQPHTEVSEIFNYSSRPISSNFSAFYQVRFQTNKIPSLSDQAGPVTSSGWSINELGLNGQIRLDQWMGSLKVYRGRYPVDIEGFNFNPAFNLDTTQFQLSGGRVFKINEKTDFYGGLSYLLHYSTPDNKGGGDNKPIPYSNSFMDFPQTRQGPGVSGLIGYLWSDNIIVNVGATLYPFVFTSFDGLDKKNLGYHGMLDAGINVKVETLPGIYISGGYSNQFFFGFSNFLDDSNFFNIGVSLDPFKMANVSQVKPGK
jgi:hypothetical protein